MELAYDMLTKPEQQVWKAVATGELVDLATGTPELDNPALGAQWGDERTVRARILCELLSRPTASTLGPLRALRLQGARISGQLDLEAATLNCLLMLQGCFFEQRIILKEARASALRLPGCHLPGIDAEQLRTSGTVELNKGVTSLGDVNMIGAHIGGQLDLDGAKLTNPGAAALTAFGMVVDQGMFCRDGFTAQGEIDLTAAHIGGQLDLDGAKLTNPAGAALTATGLMVDQDMYCRNGFTAQGEIYLRTAHVKGTLDFSGASLVKTSPDGAALTADGLVVDQDVFCRNGFTAQGNINLTAAHISGQFDLGGAKLTNPSGATLTAGGLVVDQDMLCQDGFTAQGEVNLTSAHISGQLNLGGAKLTNPSGAALTAWGLVVDQDMLCQDGFTAQGEVNLGRALISGQLGFVGARLANPAPQGIALQLQGGRATELWLLPGQVPIGVVDLRGLRLGSLYDSKATWPASLLLSNLVYDNLQAILPDRIEPDPTVGVKERLVWLRRDLEGYAPQFYEQLAAHYRRAGQPEDSRRTLIAKQHRRTETLNWPSRVWNTLLYWLVGYGYRTWQAGLWLLGFLIAGTAIFATANAHHQLTAVKSASELPHFNPLIYALDLLLPIVNLGQQDGWIPHGNFAVVYWTLILVGWVLTTAVVAGLSGALKRD
jgi:hypothetical protein